MLSSEKNRRLSWGEIVVRLVALGYRRCYWKTIQRIVESPGVSKQIRNGPQKSSKAVRPENRIKRVQFATKLLRYNYEQLLRIIWLDETSFSISRFAFDQILDEMTDEEFKLLSDVQERDFARQLMAWGAICGYLKSELVSAPRGSQFNSKDYRDAVFIAHLLPFHEKARKEYGGTPQIASDNGPAHKVFQKILSHRDPAVLSSELN